MADYNVNMKQWNGTSFDNVFPLAYNSNLLNGKTYTDIQQWVNSDKLVYGSQSYVGNGSYGSKSPNSVTFQFAPSIFFFPNQHSYPRKTVFDGMAALNTSAISDSSYTSLRIGGSSNTVYIKKSSDGRTFTWYTNDGNYDDQMNTSGVHYYCSAIGKYGT